MSMEEIFKTIQSLIAEQGGIFKGIAQFLFQFLHGFAPF